MTAQMKQLSGVRGWEYAYRKALDDRLAVLRNTLENGQGRELAEFQYLCGQIRGIREAIAELDETRLKYRLDDDADFAS